MHKKSLITYLSIIVFLLCSCDTSEQDFEKAKEDRTANAYDTFITTHPKSELAEEARDSIVAIFEKQIDLFTILHRVYEIHDDEAIARVKNIVEQRATVLYNQAIEKNSIEGWNNFISSVPINYQKDAKSRISDLLWEEESFAWKMADSNDETSLYRKYLKIHPDGIHAKQAEKRLIDIEVAEVFSSEHGSLPAMDKGYSTGVSYSVIEIENRTQYELTVSYSGPDSKRIIIPALSSKKTNIGNGHYHIAATVGHGVIPFAGTEQLDGSHFSSSFYIETRRY